MKVKTEKEDCLEFERRVKKHLKTLDYDDAPCAHGCRIFCPAPEYIKKQVGCSSWCLLREARIAVENEMA